MQSETHCSIVLEMSRWDNNTLIAAQLKNVLISVLRDFNS